MGPPSPTTFTTSLGAPIFCARCTVVVSLSQKTDMTQRLSFQAAALLMMKIQTFSDFFGVFMMIICDEEFGRWYTQ